MPASAILPDVIDFEVVDKGNIINLVCDVRVASGVNGDAADIANARKASVRVKRLWG
jgi:hypothetical protein